MTTEFTQLNLRPELEQAVIELGYQSPMPVQSAVIPLMNAGQDVIGQAQTGTGKTAAFALPILQNLLPGQSLPQALVLAPTRELASQVADAFTAYGRALKVRVLAVYGGAPYGPQINHLRRGVDVVVGTPGRLLDLMEKNVLNLSQVRTLVLDEADEMLSMGFIEDIETILAATPADRQTALFSATMPNEIRSLAERYLRSPQTVAIRGEKITGEGIEQHYFMVHRDDKTAALSRLFEMEEISSALIFVRTRSGTGELANELSLRGIPAEALSGDLSQDARERTLDRFRQGLVKVLVATDVAARGLDIDNISHVFNYDLPEDAEIYVHRIGRTGRAGKTGIAISLVSPSERRRLAQVESFTRQKLQKAVLPTEQDIVARREEQLFAQMLMWLKRGRFKREREMVEKLIEEGFDAMDVASAALKLARASEKQRPIAAVAEVADQARRERRDRPARNERSERPQPYADSTPGKNSAPRPAGYSHEAGMTRLSLNLGKAHGIRPTDIVGAIAHHADIPGHSIGKIIIRENTASVDVPEQLVGQVLARTTDMRIRRLPLIVQRA